MDTDALRAPMRGIEVVVNCVRDHADGATIKGTKFLLAAEEAEGVKKVIQFSSIAVYGDATGIVTEKTRGRRLTNMDWKRLGRKIFVRMRRVRTARMLKVRLCA
jgi:hypothetical protein